MSGSSVTVKKISEIIDRCLKPYFLPFEVAQYILHRSLEIKTFEGYRFMRPMLEIGIGDGRIPSLFFKSLIDYGVEIKKFTPNYYKIYKEVKYIKKDDNVLPFEDGFIGSIYSLSVLEHFKK